MREEKYIHYDERGVRKEGSNERSMDYSNWHRTFSQFCYAIDVDFVEYRINRGIVGLFGITGNFEDERHIINSKKYVLGRNYVEREILKDLTKDQKFNAYLVLHTKDLSLFHVWNLTLNEIPLWRVYDKVQYQKFIEGL
jgi:hypothetical protein